MDIGSMNIMKGKGLGKSCEVTAGIKGILLIRLPKGKGNSFRIDIPGKVAFRGKDWVF